MQSEPFDIGVEIQRLVSDRPDVGAVASLIGVVRADHQAPELTLSLEHYPGMTEACLAEIIDQARAQFALIDCTVVHRIGTLSVGEAIVLVAVSSAHRHSAFAACEFVMDFLKTQAPFWKKETTALGARWVEAKESDAHAATRWPAVQRG